MSNLPSVKLEELTWEEIATALDDGVTTVLIPTGSVEQHGPHLGILKDAAWAEAIGVEVAKSVGDTLVAPVIRPGTSEHHMGFAGTITYRPKTLMAVIEDYCRSLDVHGFERIVIFSMHGGNFPGLNATLPTLAKDLDNAQIISLLDTDLLIQPLMDSLDEFDIPAKARGHGGAAVTASVWHLRPDLVREDRMVPGYQGTVSTSQLMTDGLHRYAERGHMGDPTYATKELGRDVTDRIVSAFVERIREEME